jgi:hypothetical protein
LCLQRIFTKIHSKNNFSATKANFVEISIESLS